MAGKMKYIITVLSLITITLISCGDRQGDALSGQDLQTVKWYSLNEGMELAGKNGKPVFIFFYTEWCIYCKKMDREVFSDREVIMYMNENYINIRVNPEADRSSITIMGRNLNAAQLMSYSGANGYPALMFWDKKQQPVTTFPGFIEKATFLPVLKYIDSECYLKKVSLDAYIAGKAECSKK